MSRPTVENEGAEVVFRAGAEAVRTTTTEAAEVLSELRSALCLAYQAEKAQRKRKKGAR